MNAEQATAIVQLLTGTIESEGTATRKVLAAVPNGNRDFKPDPKSRSAWELAVHLAISEVWFADSILQGKFEWTGEPPTPPEMSDPAAVAKWHQTHLTDRLARLRAMPTITRFITAGSSPRTCGRRDRRYPRSTG